MKEYEEILRKRKLPGVGQTVRSRKYGTRWRVLEKREVWQPIEDDPVTKEPRIVPGIYIAYWLMQDGVMPGVGRMMGFVYTLYDNTFETNWEVVS
jgi:hypothetical protein